MANLLATCHCGAVQAEAPRKLRRLTSSASAQCAAAFAKLRAHRPTDQVQVLTTCGRTQS